MMELPVPVVLASSSATRRHLLGELVRSFRWEPPHVPESLLPGEEPEAAAVRLARSKAREVAGRRPGCVVIGADTLVVCGSDVMGKPADLEDAVKMLTRLVSAPHRVMTGVAVLCPDGRERTACVCAEMRMEPLPPDQVRRLCAEPGALSRAGAYALQPGDPNVASLSGSASAVMGLPVEELERILRELYPSAEGCRGTA